MSKRNNDFQSIEHVLNEMLTENKLQKGIDQITIKEAWKNVMGQGIFSHTSSVELKISTLIIKLSSATLREELSYGKEKIIALMNESLNKTVINKIKLL